MLMSSTDTHYAHCLCTESHWAWHESAIAITKAEGKMGAKAKAPHLTIFHQNERVSVARSHLHNCGRILVCQKRLDQSWGKQVVATGSAPFLMNLLKGFSMPEPPVCYPSEGMDFTTPRQHEGVRPTNCVKSERRLREVN